MTVRFKSVIGARARRLLLIPAVVPLAVAASLLTAGTASAATSTVTVQANTVQLTSGVVVNGTANSVVVTASGTWSVGGPYGTYGPEGSTNPFTENCALVTTAPMGALVATLDGGASWFAIGTGPTVITGSGNLGFSANDCAPGGTNFGYWGDNTGSVTVTVTSTPLHLPTATSQCKNNGWRDYGVFKNQGDCVSYVATGGRNTPAG